MKKIPSFGSFGRPGSGLGSGRGARRAAALAGVGLLSAAVGAAGGVVRRGRSSAPDSEERFRLFAENARDVIFSYRLVPEERRGFEYLSPAVETLTGHAPEEFLADQSLAGSLVHPEDRPLFVEKVVGSSDEAVMLRIRHRDGREVCAELRSKRVRDGEGRIVAVEGIARDVTERVRVEEDLRRTEERLRDAFEEAPVGMAVVRLDGVYAQVNRALCEALGYGEDELLGGGITWTSLTHPDDLEKSLEHARRVLSGEMDGYHLEKRYVRGDDGRLVWVSLDVSLVRDEAGEPRHFVVKVQDVTRERRYKEALQRLSHRHELILSSAAEGIFGLDREGRATFVNPAGARMIGLEPGGLVGRVMHEVCHHTRPDGSPYPKDECPIFRAVGRGEAHAVSDELFFRADGTSFPVEYESTPLKDGEEVVGAVVTFRDITARRAAEEALRQSEERYRRLVDLSPDAIAIHAEGRFEYVNRAGERLLGAGRGEILGREILEIVRPEDRASVAERLRLAEVNGSQPFSLGIVRFDGKVLDVEVVGAPVSYGGRPARQIVVRDITQRKRAEESLREAEERYRRLVELSPEATFVHSGGRFVYANLAGVALLGAASADEVIGLTIEETVHPDDRPALRERAAMRRAGEDLEEGHELKFVRFDGEVIETELTGVNVVYEGEQARQVVIRDITERKRAEAALRESEERLASAQRIARIGSWEHDVRTGETRWSDENFRILGLEPGAVEPTQSAFLEFVHPEDREVYWEAMHDGAPNGASEDVESRIVRPDGEVRVIHNRRRFAFDENGDLVRLSGTVQDVTERRAAEEALRESEERFRLVARATNEVIWDSDLDAGTLRWDGAVEDMFGYAPEAVEGGDWWEEHLHPDDRERVVRDIVGVISGGGSTWSAEYRFRRRDGTYAVVADRAQVLRDPETGRATRIVGSMQEVTEQRQAEERLRESEARFRLLAEKTSDLVCLHEPDGRYVYVSPSSRGLLGYEPEELLGRDPYDFFHPDDAARIREDSHEPLLEGEPTASIRYRFRRKDGSYLWLETATEAIPDDAGTVAQLQTSSRDVSERVRAEETLANAARARADFLADVSHELRTPLTVVRGNAEVALNLSREGVHAPFLEEILGEAGSMGRLVEDLLLLARSDSVEARFDRRRVSVENFLSALKSHAETLTCRRGARLVTDLSGRGSLLADPTRLEQAVLGLVDNAAKYGPEGGTVRLLASVGPGPAGSPGELVVEVRDNGPGISEGELPRVFQRFYRSRRAAEVPDEGGTGLGLAIVKSVVEAHEGRVEAESRVEGEGRGTTMRVVLPLAVAQG